MTGGSLMGDLTAEYIGDNGTGTFTQSGGTNSPGSSGGTVFLAEAAGSSGTYNLSGGLLRSYGVYTSLGTALFAQSGGTNSITALGLGDGGGTGTYSLSGSGVLSATSESLWPSGGSGVFQQTGGQNIAGLVTIGSSSRYQISGGTLQFNGGLRNLGVLDFSNSASTVDLSANNILDFSSGSIVNAGSMSFNVGSNSLVLVPSGLNLASVFGNYSNTGMTHVIGTALVVPAGQGFGGWGTINDPVNCQGTIAAAANSLGAINLKNGLVLSGNGSVAIGDEGCLTVNDSVSGMSSGALSGWWLRIGSSGTGVFTQSGGVSTISLTTLGDTPGGNGTYILSGGTNCVTSLRLADGNGAVGTYNLTGGMLILSGLTNSTGGAFNFSGGTLQASSAFSAFVPMTLGTSGGGATFDTAGYTVTLSGVISGPGNLLKTDSGRLVLSAANTYTGLTTVNAGVLSLTGSLNSSSALVLGGGAFSYAPAANGGSGNSQTVAGLAVNVGVSTVSASAGNTLALGPITRNPGGTVGFNTNTTGTMTSILANTNGILGPWATYGTGTSMKYATATGGSAPHTIAAYTGATGITSGVTGLTDTTGAVNYTLSGGGGTLTAAVSANTLQFTGAASTITASSANSLSLNGIMNTGSGTTTINGGNLIIGSTRELVLTGPGDVTVGATIQDNAGGPSALTIACGGRVTLAAANLFTGGTLISGGTLTLTNSAALQQSTLNTSGAGNVSFGALAAATLGGLTGSGGLALSNTIALPFVLSVGNNSASTTFNGSLSGSGSLVKVGSGTLTLAASNSYSGTTTLSGGMLAAWAAGALSPYSDMTVSGGTLAALAFANAIKSLTVSSGGGLEVGIGNLLTSSGPASLGGALNISGTAAGSPIELLAYSSETGSFATVSGLPAGYRLQYKATELDLVLVPEPSGLVLLAAAAIGILGFVRPRRKRARA